MNYPISFFVYFPLFLFLRETKSATMTMQNKCDFTVWPGILSNAGNPGFETTGFELSSGDSRSFQVTPGWSGRVWARTRCTFDPDTGLGACVTGNCPSGQIECNGSGATPPVTLAEFFLGSGSSKTQDYYDVSLVDGYNIPMIVEPNGGSGPCLITGCASDLNQQCPNELRAGDACKSACEAFGTQEYCCSGAYASPNTCIPSMYSKTFKIACPRAYSYAFDDATSTFTCEGADYTITFCPSSTSQQKSSTDSQASTGTQIESGSGSGSRSESKHHHKFYIGGGQFLSFSPPSSKLVKHSTILIVASMILQLLLCVPIVSPSYSF